MAQRTMAEIALRVAPVLMVEDELLTTAWAADAWRLLDLDTTMEPDDVERPLTESGRGAAGTGAGTGASPRSSPVVSSREKMLVRAIFSLT